MGICAAGIWRLAARSAAEQPAGTRFCIRRRCGGRTRVWQGIRRGVGCARLWAGRWRRGHRSVCAGTCLWSGERRGVVWAAARLLCASRCRAWHAWRGGVRTLFLRPRSAHDRACRSQTAARTLCWCVHSVGSFWRRQPPLPRVSGLVLQCWRPLQPTAARPSAFVSARIRLVDDWRAVLYGATFVIVGGAAAGGSTPGVPGFGQPAFGAPQSSAPAFGSTAFGTAAGGVTAFGAGKGAGSSPDGAAAQQATATPALGAFGGAAAAATSFAFGSAGAAASSFAFGSAGAAAGAARAPQGGFGNTRALPQPVRVQQPKPLHRGPVAGVSALSKTVSKPCRTHAYFRAGLSPRRLRPAARTQVACEPDPRCLCPAVVASRAKWPAASGVRIRRRRNSVEDPFLGLRLRLSPSSSRHARWVR
jgi:hypothetical protein